MVQNLTTFMPMQGDTDDAAIRQTALDYMYGWNDADAARQQRSLHPELAKRVVRPNDALSSAWPPGDRLDVLSALHLVQLTPHEPVPLRERGPWRSGSWIVPPTPPA